VFFFSSRRRHTRSTRDWSSDVCSSDLSACWTTTPLPRSGPGVDRRAGELPDGFAQAVRAWLLVLLDGDARARPRSHSSIYVYFSAVRPFIQRWSADYDHLREVTPADVRAALDPLRGQQLRTTLAAPRALVRLPRRR